MIIAKLKFTSKAKGVKLTDIISIKRLDQEFLTYAVPRAIFPIKRITENHGSVT